MIEAGGQAARSCSNVGREAGFLDRRQARRELAGDVELHLLHPRLRPHRPFRVGDLEVQARAVRLCWPSRRWRRRASACSAGSRSRGPGRGPRPGLEAPSSPPMRAGDRQRVAVRRVEGEMFPVDRHVDRLDLDGDAVDQVRDRVRAGFGRS